MAIAAEFYRALNGKSAFLQAESAHEIIKPVENFSWTGLGVFRGGKDIVISNGWGESPIW